MSKKATRHTTEPLQEMAPLSPQAAPEAPAQLGRKHYERELKKLHVQLVSCSAGWSTRG